MNTRSPDTAAEGYPSKRARHSISDSKLPGGFDPVPTANPSPPGEAVEVSTRGKAGQSSSFRNVSACNRCRLRKNKCDQNLPWCESCEKANVKCVGFDPITKREIPRSYVFYLETRVNYLEGLLQANKIPFVPAEVLEQSSRPGPDTSMARTPMEEVPASNGLETATAIAQKGQILKEDESVKKENETNKIDKLVSKTAMAPVQGASDPRHLGSTSGISFARVVFAAVKSSVSSSNSEKGGVRPSKPLAAKAIGSGTTSMRDSFFGLQTKPTISQAPFPVKALGLKLVNLYFEHANPQVPILHRGEFMKMFEQAYSDTDRVRTSRELYMLNIVFAIGSGIFLGDSNTDMDSSKKSSPNSGVKRTRPPNLQSEPEEYHAAAIVHLESCLSSSTSVDRIDGFGGGLEELQAVLLLAGFALLRPVAPGLWYITGVAVRLAVDLGLHYEDGKDLDGGLQDSLQGDVKPEENEQRQRQNSSKEKGRREWIRDFRRRLWWCTYSFDRLVSACVGRPFGITDQVVTTEFPSLLEDHYITPAGFLEPPGPAEPSSKTVSYHYFRLRLLQSEILQVLQHQQAQLVRAGGANQRNPYMHTQLPSPFLSKFKSFRSWRIDIDRRLWHWKETAPTKRDTGVDFSVEFLELNYWQAVIMLYRQSLSVPPQFEGEFNTTEEVESPSAHTVELREDEERVFLKVAEAGQRVLRLYRQLHRVHLVNYTFLATHHLFMAGISFLYAIWHSPIVRSRLTMDEVDFTILAATSVLGDLIHKCPPAEACRDAFDRMSKATVQMCMSTTGFASSAQGLSSRPYRNHTKSEDMSGSDYLSHSNNQFAMSNARSHRAPHPTVEQQPTRQKPQFDMSLSDLFPLPRGPSQHADLQPQYQGGPPSSSSNSTRMKSEFGNDAYGIPLAQMHSPSEYAISPVRTRSVPGDNSAIDPSLLPSPQMPQSQIHQPSYIPQDPNLAMYVNSFGSNEIDFNIQSMDFLQGGAGAGAGTDLGFGLGWEGLDHDFSEGNQVDLFDGFFFGGTNNF